MCGYCKASDDNWSTFPAPPVVVPDGHRSTRRPKVAQLMNPIDMTLQIPPGVSSEHRNSIGNDSAFNEYHRVVLCTRVVIDGSIFSHVVRKTRSWAEQIRPEARKTSPPFIRSGPIDCPDHLGPSIRTAVRFASSPSKRTLRYLIQFFCPDPPAE
jgi:hypothetical protein